MDEQTARDVLRSLWEADSEVWAERWAPIFREFAEEVVRQADLKEGERVLDVGTGTGTALVAATRAVGTTGKTVGIDQSRAQAARARANLQAAGLAATVIEMDVTSLDFPDGWFDAVVSSCGMPNAGFDDAAREVLRVLKPGGRLMMADWNVDKVAALRILSDVLSAHVTKSPSTSLARYRQALAHFNREAETLYELSDIEARLKAAGFASAEGRTISHTLRAFTLDSFVEARLARASSRAEWAEMDTHARVAFHAEARQRLAHLVHDGALEVLWPMFYVRATR
jgi:ubiquinone/menaquinone biosynthesis C-methylase UbiE